MYYGRVKRLDHQALSQNRLLSVLSPRVLESLSPFAEAVSFNRGDILAHAADKIEYCYFPTNGMISLVSGTSEGDAVEIAYVGSEDFVGFLILFGKDKMLYDAFAQSGSKCIAIEAMAIVKLFDRSIEFRTAMLRFSYVIIRQFTQTCVCNHFHTIESRICRWLTVMSERTGGVQLDITQEFLSVMLGVQRTSISPVTAELQRAEIIRYSRGMIEILDPVQLKEMACECYAIVTDEQDHFLAELNLRTTGRLRTFRSGR
jgi:CRP-like cAMP-binding protein